MSFPLATAHPLPLTSSPSLQPAKEKARISLSPCLSTRQSISASTAPNVNVPVPSRFTERRPAETRSIKSRFHIDISVIRQKPVYSDLIFIHPLQFQRLAITGAEQGEASELMAVLAVLYLGCSKEVPFKLILRWHLSPRGQNNVHQNITQLLFQ